MALWFGHAELMLPPLLPEGVANDVNEKLVKRLPKRAGDHLVEDCPDPVSGGDDTANEVHMGLWTSRREFVAKQV